MALFTQILWPGRQRKACQAVEGIQISQEIRSPADVPLAVAGSPFVCTRREAGRGWRRTVCFCICSTSWVPFPPSSQDGRGGGGLSANKEARGQLSSPDHPSYNDRWTRYGTRIRMTSTGERFQADRIGAKLSAEAEAHITDREVR